MQAAQTLRNKILTEAELHLGQPYVWDQAGPNGFDCSGFVHYVLKSVLKDAFPVKYKLSEIPATYKNQSIYFRDLLEQAHARIDCRDAKPADIIFFPAPPFPDFGQPKPPPNHIGFIKDVHFEEFITAQSTKYGVATKPYGRDYWSTRHPQCYRNIWVAAAVKANRN